MNKEPTTKREKMMTMTSAKTMKRWMGLAMCLFLASITLAPTQSRAQDTSAPSIVVGRVYDIKGDLLRYVPETKDWVAVVKDAPFGTEDTLYSGSSGMAELILPNETWIRVGNDTQIQFIDLASDKTEADVASGMARFYNKSDSAIVKATSDYGYVLADPGSVFDFYVGDSSAEVVPVKGKVTFVLSASDTSYDTEPGQPSILADKQQVTSGEALVDADWARWNANREDFWATRTRVQSPSAEYLPAPLRYDASILEEQGRWDRVSYEGSQRIFWRPTHVDVGWTPFTAGRWTEWHGDQVWIPNESFGYMTHHYGNWVLVGGGWYWAPPVASVRVGLPFLDVGFNWNPGRVSWIHRDAYVGWVPLAPRERYYGHRSYGDRFGIVVTGADFHVSLTIGSFAYAGQAVVIRQQDYWRDNDYRKVRVRNINNTTIINNYYAAPVVNNTVINNYSTNNHRYDYTNAVVSQKPHNTVLRRIELNDTTIRQGKREKAVEIKKRMTTIRKGQPNREARIEQPKVTNYMVSSKEVNRPKSEVKFQQKQIKGKDKGREGGVVPVVSKKQGQTGTRPGVAPKEVKSARGANKVQPAQSSVKPGKSVSEQERLKSPRESSQKQTAPRSGKTEKVRAPKNNQHEQSAKGNSQPGKTVNKKSKGGQNKPDQTEQKSSRGKSGGEDVKGRSSSSETQKSSKSSNSSAETEKTKGKKGNSKQKDNSK